MDDDFEAFLAAPLSDDDELAPQSWQQRITDRKRSSVNDGVAATPVAAAELRDDSRETVVSSKSRWLKPKATSSLAATLPTASAVEHPKAASFSSTLKPAALLTDRPSRFLARNSSDPDPDSLTSTIGSSFLANTQPELRLHAAASLQPLPEAPASLGLTQDSLKASQPTSAAESFDTLASSSSSNPNETQDETQDETEKGATAVASSRVPEPRLSAVQLADSFDSDLFATQLPSSALGKPIRAIPELDEPGSSTTPLTILSQGQPSWPKEDDPVSGPSTGLDQSASSSHDEGSHRQNSPSVQKPSQMDAAVRLPTPPEMQTFNDFLDNFDTSAGSTLKSMRGETPSDTTAHAGTTDKSSVAADTPVPNLVGLPELEVRSSASSSGSREVEPTLQPVTAAHVDPPSDIDVQSSRSRIPRYAGTTLSNRLPPQTVHLSVEQPAQPHQQHLDDLLQQRLRSMQARLDTLQTDSNLKGSHVQRDELSAAIAKQDTMLGAYETENKHLYNQLQAAQGGQASDIVLLQSELDRAKREAFQLRSANEQLAAQLAGAGSITDQRCQQLQLQLDAEQTAHATTRVELNTQLQQAQQVLTTVQNELQASLAKKEQQLVLLTAESGALKHSLDEAQTGLLGLKTEYDKLRTRVKSSELATQGDSGVGTSAAVPAAAMSVRARAEQKSQEMARLLQPDATSTVVELVAANHGLRKELDELRREHDAELNRRQTELSKLHRDYGEVKQEYQSKVSELTAKVSKLVAKEQEHRPHSRVKELQQELELVQAKYVALQAKETPQNSSSGVEETEALKADLAQAHSVLEQWQNHCEELKTESQSLQVQIATQQHQAADLQGRLDAALELAERHRRDRLGQEEQAAARQAKSTQALKKSKQQIADFTSEVKQRDAALASMQERLEAVHQQLAEAPLPSVVLAYERQLRQLDADKHGLELELDQAQKYQTPTMQHFNLLQRRIAQLEAHHRERERSLKHLLVEQERSAALDRQEVESKWQQRLVDEAARVNVLESELQGLMRQLRQLQRVV